MKTPLVKKHTLIKYNVVFILIVSVIDIFYHSTFLSIISVLLIVALMIWLYFSNSIAQLFGFVFVKRNICPYYIQTDCPYEVIDKCPYDTGLCHRFKKNKRFSWKVNLVICVLILSILCSVFSVLIDYDEIQFSNFLTSIDLELFIRMFAPIANSLIAAIMCAYIMDIPSRMMEYQEYFIKLLSSFDYLKAMAEDDLIELRSKIIWQLHIKDVPCMPKGLIKYDEKMLEMLKHPYFKEYSQIVNVQKEGDSILRKKVKVEYTAFNPYSKQRPIRMDIGLANSLQFGERGVTKEEAESLFIINKFIITIDRSETQIDLRSYIKILILGENEEGLMYNGKVILAPAEENSENELNFDSKNEFENSGLLYEVVDNADNKMYVKFSDKIHVKLEYEIVTPESDLCYTKRLRYPVKYFRLDYSIDDSLEYSLTGQLIGTMLDQFDVSTEMFGNNKRICLSTHNWLLPKNGAVIVHSLNEG